MSRIHERLSEDLPINSSVSIAIVDDPLERGAKLKVLRSIRDDPLAGLHSRQQIDDAQLAAGREWQRHFEGAAVGQIRAIDPTKDAVDGGRFPDPLTDKFSKSIKELELAAIALGHEGAALVMDILGQRISIRDAAEKRGLFTKSGWEYTGRRFRECLESLARLWGYAG